MRDVLILDTESTGLNDGLALDEPVQIAITDTHGRSVYQTLLRPTTPISPESTAVHGITNEMVADAPRFAEILPDLVAVIQHKTLVIWNAAFDVRLLITAAHVHQVTLPRLVYRCAMLEYAGAFGQPHPTRAGDFKWQRLSAAYEQQFVMTPDALALLNGAHDALTDCRMTADLVRLMDTHGLNKVHSSTFDVLLTHAEAKTTRKGGGYLSFTTAGSQTVNVFDSQFGRFTSAGYDAAQMLAVLTAKGAGYVHKLRAPIEVSLHYSGEYAEIHDVAGIVEEEVA